jgi:hypothetical protein
VLVVEAMTSLTAFFFMVSTSEERNTIIVGAAPEKVKCIKIIERMQFMHTGVMHSYSA